MKIVFIFILLFVQLMGDKGKTRHLFFHLSTKFTFCCHLAYSIHLSFLFLPFSLISIHQIVEFIYLFSISHPRFLSTNKTKKEKYKKLSENTNSMMSFEMDVFIRLKLSLFLCCRRNYF